MRRGIAYMFILAFICAASTVHAEDSVAPEFGRADLEHFPARYPGGGPQTALKNGDSFTVSAAVRDDTDVPTVTFDYSSVGATELLTLADAGTLPNFLCNFLSNCHTFNHGGVLSIGPDVSDGVHDVVFTATDASNNSTSLTKAIVIDNVAPVFSITSLSGDDEVIGQGSVLNISGTVDGTGTLARVFEAKIDLLSADGSVIVLPQNQQARVDGSTALFAGIADGAFENILFPIRTPNDTPNFASEVDALRLRLLAVDEASNQVWTESPPLKIHNTPEPTCCSSVLFLPGIAGSALSENGDALWPPSVFVEDIERLALTSTGESVNDITVEGVLSDFYGTSIYGGFAEFMDGLVDEGVVYEWRPRAYDWRFAPEKILSDGVKTPDGVVDLVAEVETLAANSSSGKVTVVAHSMGGLLGKALIKKLQDEGKDDLIDAFIMVGTPQFGTPQGAASLLHGDDQAIPGGFILPGVIANPATVRTVSQNMKSAYLLLPSAEYFGAVSDPVITFDEASFTEPWRNYWGEDISNHTEFTEFITGQGVVRTNPAPNDLGTPEILDLTFVADANIFHDTFDGYGIPDHIRVVQVAGWGMPTVKSFEYKNKHLIFDGYETKVTVEGDDTVVYPSSLGYSTDDKYYFNLALFNKDQSEDTQHRDLLNAQPLQLLIEEVLQNTEILTSSYLTDTIPPLSEIETQLLVTTRSPVILGANDENGNFTGIDPDQNLNSEFLEIKEEIPGSTFLSSGGDQHIFLPKEGTYTFMFKGTGNGPATVETATFSNDSVTPIASYSDMQVTPDTTATFAVNTSLPEETVIELDANGDGTTDATVHPDGHTPLPTLSELIATLKAKIQTLDTKQKLKEKLLKKVEKVEKKIAKQKDQQASKAVMNLEANITKKITKGKISDSEGEEIIELLNVIEAAL